MMLICFELLESTKEKFSALRQGFRDNETKLIYFKQLRKGRDVKKVLTIHSVPGPVCAGLAKRVRKRRGLFAIRNFWHAQALQNSEAGVPVCCVWRRDPFA